MTSFVGGVRLVACSIQSDTLHLYKSPISPHKNSSAGLVLQLHTIMLLLFGILDNKKKTSAKIDKAVGIYLFSIVSEMSPLYIFSMTRISPRLVLMFFFLILSVSSLQ